jgi:hypothetical protein
LEPLVQVQPKADDRLLHLHLEVLVAVSQV